ncbi:hypothetical protein BDW66DRAFT_125023 [Aspergillus desertorum]
MPPLLSRRKNLWVTRKTVTHILLKCSSALVLSLVILLLFSGRSQLNSCILSLLFPSCTGPALNRAAYKHKQFHLATGTVPVTERVRRFKGTYFDYNSTNMSAAPANNTNKEKSSLSRSDSESVGIDIFSGRLPEHSRVRLLDPAQPREFGVDIAIAGPCGTGRRNPVDLVLSP